MMMKPHPAEDVEKGRWKLRDGQRSPGDKTIRRLTTNPPPADDEAPVGRRRNERQLTMNPRDKEGLRHQRRDDEAN